jgi:hypothetical protein
MLTRSTTILLAAFALAGQAAAAEVVVQATAPNGAVIMLHKEDVQCVGGAKMATWRSPNGTSTVSGCFKISTSGIVSIVWFDTDTSNIPVQKFKQPDGV